MEFKSKQEVIVTIEGNEYKARIESPQEKKNSDRTTVYIHDKNWHSNKYYSANKEDIRIAELPTSVTGLVYDTNDDKYKLRMNPSEGQTLLAILEYKKGEYKDLIEVIKQCAGYTEEEALERFQDRIVS